jgi:hypothetical protein
MDVKELENWLKTGEGRDWMEARKKPLLDNRDSILGELKAASGRLSELGQRLSDTENALMSEKAVTSKYLIDTDLTALLRKTNVFEEAIPHTLETLKAAYGLSVKVDGDNRKAVGVLKREGKDIEAELPDIVADWKTRPLSKCFIQNGNSGSGAPGAGRGAAPVLNALRDIPGRELAKMSDNEFRNMVQNTVGDNK